MVEEDSGKGRRQQICTIEENRSKTHASLKEKQKCSKAYCEASQSKPYFEAFFFFKPSATHPRIRHTAFPLGTHTSTLRQRGLRVHTWVHICCNYFEVCLLAWQSPTALESSLVYTCELWVCAACPALQGSNVSHVGVAHVSKNYLEYSEEFLELASPPPKKMRTQRACPRTTTAYHSGSRIHTALAKFDQHHFGRVHDQKFDSTPPFSPSYVAANTQLGDR